MKTVEILLLSDNCADNKIYSFDNLQLINLTRESNEIKQYCNHSTPYILLGPHCNTKRQIYVGQTKNILNRFNQHKRTKSFWTEIIFFKNTQGVFTKTDIEWLESKLITMFIDSNLVDVITNYQLPTNIPTNESDDARLHQMLQNIRTLLILYGCPLNNKTIVNTSNLNQSKSIIDRVAQSFVTNYSEDDYNMYNGFCEDDVNIYIKTDKINATYFDIGDGRCIILKGSVINTESCSQKKKKLLEKYNDKISNNLVLSDILVNSEKIAKEIIM